MSYRGSIEHIENCRLASIQATIKHSELRMKRIERYLLTPDTCMECGKIFPYEKRGKKFCNNSCSAKYNNLHRINPYTDEVKEQIRSKLKGRKIKLTSEQIERKRQITIKYFSDKRIEKYGTDNNIIEIKCKICGNVFKTRRNNPRCTCSRICLIEAKIGNRKYNNGSRKTIYFFNKYQNKEIVLESSWELKIANELMARDIKWIRPAPIIWNDGADRLYYPDFYLPDYNMYLDPKNPYCMAKDEEKMKQISNKVNIKYGNVNEILTYIAQLV